jgi:SEC-C motif-containing protein
MSTVEVGDPCPCGSATYGECCSPYVNEEKPAPTAEALMRSRYSAFVVGNAAYIGETLHRKSRGDHDEAGTKKWAQKSEWLGLEVLDTDAGQENDGRGEVEFIARYRQKGELIEHHERATFVKEDGKWWFLEGTTPAAETYVAEGPKVGRNEPCPCGSGKKYKKCCAGK